MEYSDTSDEMGDPATDEESEEDESAPTRTYGPERFAGLDQSLFDLDDGDEDDVERQGQEEYSAEEDEDDDEDDSDMYL